MTCEEKINRAEALIKSITDYKAYCRSNMNLNMSMSTADVILEALHNFVEVAKNNGSINQKLQKYTERYECVKHKAEECEYVGGDSTGLRAFEGILLEVIADFRGLRSRSEK